MIKLGVAAVVGLTALGAMRPALQAQQGTTQSTPAQTTPNQTTPTQTPPAAPQGQAAQSTPAAPQAAGQDEAKTIWSGVFTDDQAKRGRALFTQYCQSCHGADMGGGEMAPPLSGSTFLTNWDGQTVGDLEERIRITMPQGDEGSLSHQQVVDILSAIFAANNAPAGTTELPREVPLLKTIKITARNTGR